VLNNKGVCLKNQPIRDLREYSKQTNIRLIVGALFVIFIIGGGLIYHFYGRDAAITGLLCILSGLTPIILIALFLIGIDLIIKHSNRE